MSSESDFNSDFYDSVENDEAGKRLKKADAQEKKGGRNLTRFARTNNEEKKERV